MQYSGEVWDPDLRSLEIVIRRSLREALAERGIGMALLFTEDELLLLIQALRDYRSQASSEEKRALTAKLSSLFTYSRNLKRGAAVDGIEELARESQDMGLYE